MRLTFLGTGAATSCPLAFCRCAGCVEARRRGGADIRKRSALLINRDLIVDFGPDVLTAAALYGIDITQVRYWLQTHPHSDHYDPGHIITRIVEYAPEDVPPLVLYASKRCIEIMSDKLDREESGASFCEPEWLIRMNMQLNELSPGTVFEMEKYKGLALRAEHGEPGESLLYIIQDANTAVLYATDTMAIPPDAIEMLVKHNIRLDAAILDHTYGPGICGGGHMNAEQVAEACVALRAADVLKKEARLFATHISHEGMPLHRELSIYGAEHGYEIAYDGLVVEI